MAVDVGLAAGMAKKLGAEAFAQGLPAVAGSDPALGTLVMNMEIPAAVATMQAWLSGWEAAKAATPAKPAFDEALSGFLDLAQGMLNAHYRDSKYVGPVPVLSLMPGSRYVKIVRNEKGSQGQSVWGFVEKKTGLIYKAASWRAPAKHARGSIYGKNPLDNMSWTGPNYMK